VNLHQQQQGRQGMPHQQQQQQQGGFMEALVREVAVKLPVFPADDLARVLLAVAAAGARPSQLWLQVRDWSAWKCGLRGVTGSVTKGATMVMRGFSVSNFQVWFCVCLVPGGVTGGVLAVCSHISGCD
jgi:hypothetical protein